MVRRLPHDFWSGGLAGASTDDPEAAAAVVNSHCTYKRRVQDSQEVFIGESLLYGRGHGSRRGSQRRC